VLYGRLFFHLLQIEEMYPNDNLIFETNDHQQNFFNKNFLGLLCF